VPVWQNAIDLHFNVLCGIDAEISNRRGLISALAKKKPPKLEVVEPNAHLFRSAPANERERSSNDDAVVHLKFNSPKKENLIESN
jgi:hypothetical protein